MGFLKKVFKSVKKVGGAVGKVFNKVVKPIVSNIPVVGSFVKLGDSIIGKNGLGKFIQPLISKVGAAMDNTASPTLPADEAALDANIQQGLDMVADGKLNTFGNNVPTYSATYSATSYVNGELLTPGKTTLFDNNYLDTHAAEQQRVEALDRVLRAHGVDMDLLVSEMKQKQLA